MHARGEFLAAAFEVAGVQLLRDVALEVVVERGVGKSDGRPLVVSAMGDELVMDCTRVQYALLVRMWQANISGRGDRIKAAEGTTPRSAPPPAPTPQARSPQKQTAMSPSGKVRRPSHDPPSTSDPDRQPRHHHHQHHPEDGPLDDEENNGMKVSVRLPLLTLRLSDATRHLASGGRSYALARLDLREMRLCYDSSTPGRSDTHLSLQSLHVMDELQTPPSPLMDSVRSPLDAAGGAGGAGAAKLRMGAEGPGG